MSGQIFLYETSGRTLWVPRHTPSPTETKPVCMLNFVTPMELSRSFYLFDYPVKVVDNAQLAAMSPNAKTANEVQAAVNDFRRVCAEDQSFLLQRCYNPQTQHSSTPPQNLQQQQQAYPASYSPHHQPSPVPLGTPIGGGPLSEHGSGSSVGQSYGSGYNASPNASNSMDNMALLQQLLQQQQQQQSQPQSQPQMSPNSYASNSGSFSGYGEGSYGSGRGYGSQGGNNSGSGMPYAASYGQQAQAQAQQQLPPPPPQAMMAGGYPSYQGVVGGGYAMSPMMYGNMGIGGPQQQRGNRNNNRRDGSNTQNSGSYSGQMMMMPGMPYPPQQQQRNQRREKERYSNMGRDAPPPNSRTETEPITIDVTVPEEIKAVYMNSAQPLVVATMFGPHITVWLREHPIPASREDRKFVFGRNGVILMLKASFEDVKNSKPVELFGAQLCTHFFMYGYCNRENCFHEHHSEVQLRELIAARHVQLKAMTKQQRHALIDEIEEKEKQGILALHKWKADRNARRLKPQQEQQGNVEAQPAPYITPASVKDSALAINSDEEEDGNEDTTQQQQQPAAPLEITESTTTTAPPEMAVAEKAAPVSTDAAAPAKIGVTDSDGGEESDGHSSSSGSESGSGGSHSRSHSSSNKKAKVKSASSTPKKASPAASGEDEEEEEVKTAGKKRGRAAAPKKSSKRSKK